MSDNTLYIAALKLSIKKWIWLFNNPGVDETKSPVWEKVRKLQNRCGLCDLFLKYGTNDIPYTTLCGKCTLNRGINNCFYRWSPYQKWSRHPDMWKQSVARIVCILRREYEKITGDKKTFRKGE